MPRFIKAGQGVYNIAFIHSMTMNKDGEQGWLKVENTDKEGGYEKIRLSPEEFKHLENLLLTCHIVEQRIPQVEPKRLKELTNG